MRKIGGRIRLSQDKVTSFISRAIKSKFARNVAIVAGGTAAAQAITVAFGPIITRLYGPEAFGLLGVFTSLVAILTPVAALAYPIAIVLPKEDADAVGLARLSFYVALAVSAVVAVALMVGGEWLLALLGSEAIAPYAMLVPLSMLFAACMQIARQWLIRKRLYHITARVAVLQALFLNSAKAGFGWLNPVASVLVVLTTAGQALHAAMLWLGIRHIGNFANTAIEGQARVSLRELARKHYDFPLYRAPELFVNAASQGLPVLMLASFFSPSAAGLYSLGRMVMGIPSNLIGQSVGDVFYPRITEAAHNQESLLRLIIKATLSLAAVGFLPYAIIVAAGPWLFSFVFGAEWYAAGEYARWLALWLFFMFLNNPSVRALPVLSAQGFHLVFTVVTIIIRLGVLAAGFFVYESDLVAVALFSGAGAVLNIALVVIVCCLAHNYDIRESQA